jgi:hypothetical protein
MAAYLTRKQTSWLSIHSMIILKQRRQRLVSYKKMTESLGGQCGHGFAHRIASSKEPILLVKSAYHTVSTPRSPSLRHQSVSQSVVFYVRKPVKTRAPWEFLAIGKQAKSMKLDTAVV